MDIHTLETEYFEAISGQSVIKDPQILQYLARELIITTSTRAAA